MSSFRVAHFIETDVAGGAEQLVIDICKTMSDGVFSPVILHFDHPFFKSQCDRYGIEHHTVWDRRNFKSSLKLPLFALSFSKQLQTLGINCLHSHLYGPITGAALAAKMAGIKHIGTLHDVYMIEEKHSRIHFLEMASLLGTKLITVSNTMKQFYQQEGRFKVGAIQSIYNGVETPEKPSKEEKKTLRNQLGVPEDSMLIVNTGRLVRLKRHDLMLDAVSIATKNAECTVLIVGEGPEKEKIQNQVEQLGLRNIVMTGHRKDVDKLLQISDCYIQCSETEGLSMSILEAMAAGLPCIVTDVGGNAELVINDRNGWLVPMTPEVIAGRIGEIIRDEVKRKEMGRASFEMFNENFLLETTIEKYLKLYAQVLE